MADHGRRPGKGEPAALLARTTPIPWFRRSRLATALGSPLPWTLDIRRQRPLI